jgi:hypothetical protein
VFPRSADLSRSGPPPRVEATCPHGPCGAWSASSCVQRACCLRRPPRRQRPAPSRGAASRAPAQRPGAPAAPDPTPTEPRRRAVSGGRTFPTPCGGAHRDRLRRRGERLDARSEGRGGRHVRVPTGPAREPQAVRAGVVPRVRLDAHEDPGLSFPDLPGERPLLPVRERERDGGVDAGRRRRGVPSERPSDDPRGAPRTRARDRHGRSRRGSGRPAPAGRDRDRDAEGLRDAPDRGADRPALQPPRRIPRRRPPTTRSLARRWPGRCSAPRPRRHGSAIRSRATRP